MFTGLVEEVGRIQNTSKRGNAAVLTVEANVVLEGLKVGDSISVSGVCQTVVKFDRDSFQIEAVQETLEKTRLGEMRPGECVNLERAMQPSDRLGGHIVQGHVDGLVQLKSITDRSGSKRLRLVLPLDDARYVVEKGSVTLDGISLTVAALGPDWFEVEIIPHTWAETTLSDRKAGDHLHIEWDIIAKYVARMLSAHLPDSGLTVEKLIESGFGPSH